MVLLGDRTEAEAALAVLESPQRRVYPLLLRERAVFTLYELLKKYGHVNLAETFYYKARTPGWL